MQMERDVLKSVSRAANAALTSQAAHHDGFQRLADAAARIEQHWDHVEGELVAERGKVSRLEGELSLARHTIETERASFAGEIAAERDTFAVKVQSLAEKARDDLRDLRQKSEADLAAVQEVATQAIADAQAAHQDVEARLRSEIARLSAANNDLTGQNEILRFDNEQLSQGLNLLLTSTQNTSRAMLEEEAQINSLVDRLSSRLDASINVVEQALGQSGDVVQLFGEREVRVA